MPAAQRFEPTDSAFVLWVELGVGALLLAVAVPVVVWWRDLDASIPLQAGMIAVGLLAWVLKVWFGRRHRGTLVVDDDGVTLHTAAGTNRVAWGEIHRLHRFGDRLVFETTPPHRRYTLLLEGHEDHLPAIAATLRSRAPITDLRWMNGLEKLLE
jgi:hypothetical protein